jgi:putative ABC transport system permease protein
MFRLSLRNIADHKGRFVMTALAVILGVSFVVSSFVLSDTIKATFRSLFGEANQNVDLVVRTKGGFDTGPGGIERAPLPQQAVDLVKQVPGVEDAEGPVQGIIPALLDPKGKQVPNNGPPTIGFSWGANPKLNPFRVAEGRKPRAGEVALDQATYEAYGFKLGTTIDVQLASGAAKFPLVGVAVYGDSKGFGGAHALVFETTTAQQALNRAGLVDKVQVVVAGNATVNEVRQRIRSAAPEGIEVVTGAQVATEDASTFEVLASVIGGVLLGFAGVALFVSAFYIFNTFNIILGQRTHELALLRAVGASPRQVRRSVMTESLGLGAVSSVIGIGGGLGLAAALQKIMNAVGFTLPAGSPELRLRTVILGLAIGIGVTFLASIVPAFRSSTVTPLAALRDDATSHALNSQRRLIIGMVLTGLGGLILANGLFLADETRAVLTSLALGAIAVFLGVSMLSALVAGRVTTVLGQPVRALLRTPGRLARDNAARNPQRTSSTASALTIGLALVTMATIVGASLKASLQEATKESVTADYFVAPGSAFGFGFSPTVAQRIAQLPEVASSSPIRFGAFRFKGATKDITALDPSTAASLFNFDVTAGGLDKLTDDSIMVQKDPATDLGLKVGDKVDVEFSRTGHKTFTVAGIYNEAALAGNYLISLGAFNANYGDQLDVFVAMTLKDGVSATQLDRALRPILKDFPQLKLQDRSAFVAGQSGQVDQLLIVINILLLLAVFIAVLGIGITVALSVLERIREIGLLRAVGMTRRQTRRMVRWEGAIVSAFGATIGVVVGIVFGLAALAALPESFATTTRVPIPNLVILLVFAVFAGLLAAIFPARRAGTLDVLAAIASE